MKLPTTTFLMPSTQNHLVFSQCLDTQVRSNGIQPEVVEFVNDVLANQVQERANITALLRAAGDPVGAIARSGIRVLQVFNSWHTSPSDANEHLTIYFPVNGETCHVYRNGTFQCFPVN